ncbi:MAG: hypothetical protein LBT83_08670 [Tannerella sp.]|nr:hypothetical protein [Tannerella sp.]
MIRVDVKKKLLLLFFVLLSCSREQQVESVYMIDPEREAQELNPVIVFCKLSNQKE